MVLQHNGPGRGGVTRRSFLKGTSAIAGAVGLAPVISTPFVSRALADTKTLTIVQWSHFVPEFDTWFDGFARDWGTKNGVSVTVDHVPHLEIPMRAAAEVQAKAGHDLFMWNGAGGPHVYKSFLTDLTNVVDYVQSKHGEVDKIGRQIAYNDESKTWSAFPDYYIRNPGMYRKDLWDEIGMTPDSWDDVRIGGAKLKQKGHPVGISLGHSVDPNVIWRGVLWSYGSTIQDQTGKKVTLDSKETVEAVKFGRALYQEAMTPEVLSWDDASDNRAMDSGRACYIMNPISAYRSAQKINPKLADDIFLWKTPKGPVTRLTAATPNSYGIWNFARNKDAAADFLKYYADHWVEAFKASTGYNSPIYANIVPKPWPIISYDPTSHPPDKLKVLETCDEWHRAFGYPGPAWGATDEVVNDFIVPDMMAKAATGQMTPEESVKWAQKETELIFKRWEA
jgi:multiple sugar transport system substrate-binding protein